MKPKLDLKKFARFFWGVATKKEKDHVYKSQESDSMLKQDWNSAGNDIKITSRQEREELLKNIYRSKTNSQDKVIAFNQKLLRIAAIFILLIAVGSVLYIFTDLYDRLGQSQITFIEKSNPKGLRSKIVLSDNTVIWLNADSKIRYAENFDKQDLRKVELTGEAYFNVQHNPDKPFIVQANGMNVRVLGTQFNVRAYPEYDEVKTTLVEGKVSLSDTENRDAQYLAPGEMGVYERLRKKITVRKGVQLKEVISWKDGMLVFDNDSFTEIALELERWYGIEIHIDEKLKGKYRYTMTITDENVQEVCKLIQETTPIECRIKGNRVTFGPQK